jgi:hypothetical protein
MARPIVLKSSELLARVDQGIAGMEEFSDSFIPAGISLEEMQSKRNLFFEKVQIQKKTFAEAEHATQEMEQARVELVDALKRLRDAVYAYFGKYDARILKFGLDTLPKRRKKNGANENGADNPTP